MLFAVFIILFCLFVPGPKARINALTHFSTKAELAEILLCLHRQMHASSCETLLSSWGTRALTRSVILVLR